MLEFQCEVCGKIKRVRAKYFIGRFCGTECYQESRKRNSVKNEERVCLFQPESIICKSVKCDKCGWNPAVAKARLEAMGVVYE